MVLDYGWSHSFLYRKVERSWLFDPQSRLFDKWSSNGIEDGDDGIPVDINSDRWFCVDDETDGRDYGGMLLNENESALLKSQGIEPLTEEYWEHLPALPNGFEIYQLLGIPSETAVNLPHELRREPGSRPHRHHFRGGTSR